MGRGSEAASSFTADKLPPPAPFSFLFFHQLFIRVGPLLHIPAIETNIPGQKPQSGYIFFIDLGKAELKSEEKMFEKTSPVIACKVPTVDPRGEKLYICCRWCIYRLSDNKVTL